MHPFRRRRESSIEAAFVRRMSVRGLISLKLNVSAQRGWPDRMVLLAPGRVLFVELKRPGGKLSARQEVIHDALRRLGHEVGVFADADAAAAWVDSFRPGATSGALHR